VSLELVQRNLEVLYHALYLPLRLPPISRGNQIRVQYHLAPEMKLLDLDDQPLADASISVSPSPGFVYDDITVKITVPSDAQVFYTLDGTDPLLVDAFRQK
jgi:hypothetical protein